MKTFIDSLITIRILSLLTTPWEQTDAFRLGIIDKTGAPVKRVSTLKSSEQEAYTPLVRLVFKLKRMLEKVPGANNQLVTYAAAYALIREAEDLEKIEALSESSLTQMLDRLIVIDGIDKYIHCVKMYTEASGLVDFKTFREEAPANSAAATSGVDLESKSVSIFKKPATRKIKTNDGGN